MQPNSSPNFFFIKKSFLSILFSFLNLDFLYEKVFLAFHVFQQFSELSLSTRSWSKPSHIIDHKFAFFMWRNIFFLPHLTEIKDSHSQFRMARRFHLKKILFFLYLQMTKYAFKSAFDYLCFLRILTQKQKQRTTKHYLFLIFCQF